MPFRTYRVTLNNHSDYLTLTHLGENTCEGDWTGNEWRPPASIGPGESGGLQIESNSIIVPRGCEAWVKYEVHAPEGGLGQIYIYVDNPAFGVTTPPKVVASASDVTPDCNGGNGGSAFPDSPPTQFTVKPEAWVDGASATEITSVADLVWWYTISGLPTAALPFFGSAGIVPHPEATFDVSGYTPQYADPGQIDMKPLRQAGLDDWAGEWRSPHTSVSIARLGTRRVRISAAETGGDPPFRISGASALGMDALGARLDSHGLHMALGMPAEPSEHDEVFRFALERILDADDGASRSVINTRFGLLVSEVARQHGLRAPDPSQLREIAALASEVVFTSSWTLRLGPIVLSRYGLYQEGSVIAKRLAYQRLDATDDVVADDVLAQHFDIR